MSEDLKHICCPLFHATFGFVKLFLAEEKLPSMLKKLLLFLKFKVMQHL